MYIFIADVVAGSIFMLVVRSVRSISANDVDYGFVGAAAVVDSSELCNCRLVRPACMKILAGSTSETE